jgi:hypothetical protein
MRWKSIAIASAALVAVGGIVFAGVRGNTKEEGVVTLPSGLQHKVFRAGNGETPEDGARGLPARKKGGPAIGPNETLIFEGELLAIKPEAQARAQAASVKAAPAAKER